MSEAKRRRKQRELKEQLKKQGKQYPPSFTLPNRKSSFSTVEEEKAYIQSVTEEKLKAYANILPGLLKKLSQIPDPRNPKKITHQITVMMLYGILMFAFQMTSRRKTNRDMTSPQLLKNLKALFPELVDMPHQDTLCRLLENMDVSKIETAYIQILKN